MGSLPPVVNDDAVSQLRAELEEMRLALKKSTVERQRSEQAAAQAVEQERRVLAQILHDTVSQSLTGVYYQAQVIVKKLQKDRSNGVQEIMDLAETIHSAVLELSSVTRGLQSQTGGEAKPTRGHGKPV